MSEIRKIQVWCFRGIIIFSGPNLNKKHFHYNVVTDNQENTEETYPNSKRGNVPRAGWCLGVGGEQAAAGGRGGELARQAGEETGAGGEGMFQEEGITVQSPRVERDYSTFKELMGILVAERQSLK